MKLISLSTINEIFNSSVMSFELVVWSIYIGFIIASVMSLYYKRYLGAFVRALIENEAFSPDSAMTLEELGFEKNSFIKSQLRGRGVFSALVYQKDDKVEIHGNSAIPVYHDKIDFTTASFFIPYELRIRAEMKFEKKGTHIMGVVVAIIAFFILALLATIYGETLWDLAKSVFEQ